MAKEKETKIPEETMNFVNEEIAKMLKAAEEKAQSIIEAAEAKAKKTEKNSAEIEAANAAGEEYVTIKLFKDSGKYNDDVFVAINGEGCNIPRGVPHRIKKKFASILEQSDLQDAKTAQYMAEKSQEFENESRRLNV